jgi:hypothetical protein
MYLGLDHQTGLAYEGLGGVEFPVTPNPSVSQAKLIESDQDWQAMPSGVWNSAMAWVFREDSFDAVTRTRRGRLYEPQPGESQPSTKHVDPHHFELRSAAGNGKVSRSLHIYSACNTLLSKPNQGMGSILGLGSNRASSAWRIIQTEVLANGCVMVTLKSLTAFGIVPAIDISKIDQEFRKSVTQSTGKVLDSAFKESPISVIDHCRDALTIILSRWLVQQGNDRGILGEDLAKVAAAVSKSPHEKLCVGQMAQVIARLHVRGKGNEQHTRGLRIPVEEDAELAIQSLGFTLRDIGWAAD